MQEDIKAFLKSYLPALRSAERWFREWDNAEDVSVRSPKLDGMPRSTGVHGLELQVELIERCRTRAEKERDKALKILDQIEDMVDRLEDADQRRLIRDRYITGMEWAEVADDVNMSLRTVYRVHGQALAEMRRNEETDSLEPFLRDRRS